MAVVKFLVVLGAEMAGKQHAGAGGQSGEKAHQKPGNIGAGGDGGQGGGAHEIARHNAVHAVVEVLKYLPHQDGQGKEQELFGDVALSQVCACFSRHIIILSAVSPC